MSEHNKVVELNAIIKQMWTEHADQGRTTSECLMIVAENLKKAVPVGKYTISDLLEIVKGALPDSNILVPGNIKKGVTILGVEGAMEAGSGRLPDYIGAITVTPSDQMQTLKTAGKSVEHDIVIEPSAPCPEPDPYAIYGGKLEVTPSIHREVLPTRDSLVQENIVINPVTSAVDVNIAPQNIKKGVTILGIEGTLEDQLPVYDGATEVIPREVQQVLNTAGKTLTDNIIVHGMDMPAMKPVADILRPLDGDEACISWIKPQESLYAQTVDLNFFGDINTAFCARVKDRMDLSIIRNNGMRVRLEASGGRMGSPVGLFTFFDGTFFRQGQVDIIVDKTDTYNSVSVILDAVGYVTPASAAHFDWLKTDEEALAWLDILAETQKDQKYWTVSSGYDPSMDVQSRYQAKGYTYTKEVLA